MYVGADILPQSRELSTRSFKSIPSLDSNNLHIHIKYQKTSLVNCIHPFIFWGKNNNKTKAVSIFAKTQTDLVVKTMIILFPSHFIVNCYNLAIQDVEIYETELEGWSMFLLKQELQYVSGPDSRLSFFIFLEDFKIKALSVFSVKGGSMIS